MLHTQAAVEYVIQNTEYNTCYKIAGALSTGELIVQPTQVSRYYKGLSRMSEKTAIEFEAVFGIEIADVHRAKGRPSTWD